MSVRVPVAILRAFAWIGLIVWSALGVYLIVNALGASGSGVLADSTKTIGTLVGVGVAIGSICWWALLMAIAGGAEAAVQIRDSQE